MLTIKQAFQTFLEKLELTDAEAKEASDQHIYMRTELEKRLDVEKNFLSGSYGRRTAIRPLNDIDIFLVLSETETSNRESDPGDILDVVEETLEAIYPSKTCKRQSRSVNIEFSGTGIAYDVVPAFRDEEDVYLIPDTEAKGWIKTNPEEHKALSTQANENANKKLKPLLKAVKHSNHAHGKPARSFHLEVLSWEILDSDPGSYMEGLLTLLDGLVERICDTCPDPAGLGPDIQPSAARCLESKAWLEKIAGFAREASEFANDGKTGEAHWKMHEIFGPQWPEKGTEPGSKRVAPPLGLGGGVDDSRVRFG